MIKFEPLFSIQELCNEIGLNKYTIYKKIRENKFPKGVKINGKRYFKPDVIKHHFEEMGINVQITKQGTSISCNWKELQSKTPNRTPSNIGGKFSPIEPIITH